jgi:hypothetical protein
MEGPKSRRREPPGSNDEPLTREQLREIRRRVQDHDDPVRYMVVSRLLPNWKLWFDVESDCYCSDIDSGTAFKRRDQAAAVLRALGKGSKARRARDLELVRVTTKGGKRRVLRYLAASAEAKAGAAARTSNGGPHAKTRRGRS